MMTGLGIGADRKYVVRENGTSLQTVGGSRTVRFCRSSAIFAFSASPSVRRYSLHFFYRRRRNSRERVRESLGVTSPGEAGVSGGVFAELVTGSAQVIVPDADRLREYVPDHIADSTQELIVRQIMRVIRGTLTEGYQDLFVAAAIFSVVGFVCALAVVRMERDSYGK